MSQATSYPSRAARAEALADWFRFERVLIAHAQVLLNPLVYAVEGLAGGVQRRWRRERRRRHVGRAYDMALEIARLLPRGSRVLDVGCGSGFIAHHLGGVGAARVTGIDVRRHADAPIEYASFDGERFPVLEASFDAVLLCYVLHHAQDQSAFLGEVRRVLRAGGVAVVYEDVPATAWDRVACAAHDRAWRARTGPCRFRLGDEWRALFESAGFRVVSERTLSRWRNLAHPVRRTLFVLGAADAPARLTRT
jgi:ubiquinone/menaquinone biosynthesis C-methylase UbiE